MRTTKQQEGAERKALKKKPLNLAPMTPRATTPKKRPVIAAEAAATATATPATATATAAATPADHQAPDTGNLSAITPTDDKASSTSESHPAAATPADDSDPAAGFVDLGKNRVIEGESKLSDTAAAPASVLSYLNPFSYFKAAPETATTARTPGQGIEPPKM